MELSKHKRVFLFYFLIQLVIWVKAFIFFQQYGHGYVAALHLPLPECVLFGDFVFHETMHFLILISAFVFGRRLGEIDDKKLVGIVIAAVLVHNAGYWLTNVFESVLEAGFDFLRDSVTLYVFIIASNYLGKKYAFFRNFRIPLLD